jgi:hypothetical protein
MPISLLKTIEEWRSTSSLSSIWTKRTMKHISSGPKRQLGDLGVPQRFNSLCNSTYSSTLKDPFCCQRVVRYHNSTMKKIKKSCIDQQFCKWKKNHVFTTNKFLVMKKSCMWPRILQMKKIMCGRYHNLANDKKIIHSPTIVQTKKKSCIHQQFGKWK